MGVQFHHIIDSPKPYKKHSAFYEGFLTTINGDVGELELAAGEQMRGVKVRLRRAASRLNRATEIWDAERQVYQGDG